MRSALPAGREARQAATTTRGRSASTTPARCKMVERVGVTAPRTSERLDDVDVLLSLPTALPAFFVPTAALVGTELLGGRTGPEGAEPVGGDVLPLRQPRRWRDVQPVACELLRLRPSQ